MLNKLFLIPMIASIFLMPSLSQAWSFTGSQPMLHKDAGSCWQIIKVQDQSCVGDNCPESGRTELPPEEEEEPDCE